MKKFLLIALLALMGCSSAELVENWKNPDIVIFDANKVLIVGMTQNEDARSEFETKLKREFKKRGVDAERSIDLFDVAFTNSHKSEEEISAVEEQLLDKDFDAILFTKILGSESRKPLVESISELDDYNSTFREDYMTHQNIYYDTDYYEEYRIYHAETSLYCICVDKERSLIWKGSIDILDPIDVKKTVNDYIKLVVLAMEEQDLIFRKEKSDEVTGI
ncbi:MAG: hypothetical protein WBN39_01670 [Flavobacteriaceae bacterium]